MYIGLTVATLVYQEHYFNIDIRNACQLYALADIFTNFGGIVSGPVAFLGSVCFRRVLISATSALGKSKVIEETKLF